MEHLAAWCAKHVRPEEGVETMGKLLDFMREYPDVAERKSYREMLDLIERNEREGIGQK